MVVDLMHLATIYTLLLIASFWIVSGEELEQVHLTNSWAVHIENGNVGIADQIAQKHGFINIGQVRIQYVLCSCFIQLCN